MQRFNFALFLLPLIFYENGGESLDLETKIVGGIEATPNEFPWAVRLQFKSSKSLLCGGTLIQDDLVLTAAHCISDLSLSTIEVVAGEHDTNKNDGTEQTRSVKYALFHQSYNEDIFDNDIGLIAVTSKFNIGGGVQTARLPSANDIPTSSATAVGWGVLSEEFSSASNVLMKVSLDQVSNTVCSSAYNIVTNRMICYGSFGKDSCQGDSGGGLICGNVTSSNICGIVSFGNGCGRLSFPGVYTKVSSYLSWISANLQENTNNCNCYYVGHSSELKASAIIWMTIGVVTIQHLIRL